MNILNIITSAKRREVNKNKILHPVKELEHSAQFNLMMPSLFKALSVPGPSIICEFKRRSPSGGDIRPDADVNYITKGYSEGGASAISILTENEFFGGANQDLLEASNYIKIPLLRKDFIIDEYQVVESKSIGASAILLIADILESYEVKRLSSLAFSLGLEVLFEIHDVRDIEKIDSHFNIIGINNRDLKTFEVSMENSLNLFQHLSQGSIKVAESGIQSVNDVVQLSRAGFDAFLIGEKFMRSDEPGNEAARFINELRSVVQ